MSAAPRSSRAIVVMGVSGCGKSTLAAAIATRLGWSFVEGDALHPPGNIAKMAAGVPLTDADREPFLRNVAAALAARPGGAVAACSALRRRYRDLIRDTVPGALFVLPMVSRDRLVARLSGRTGHFMPVSLLDSQLATLEPPTADERALAVDGMLPLDEQVDLVRDALDHIG